MQTKTKTGYAIMTKKGRLEMFDARMPIYWRKDVATNSMKDKGYDGVIVRVVVEADE